MGGQLAPFLNVMAFLAQQPVHATLGLPVVCALDVVQHCDDHAVPLWMCSGNAVADACTPQQLYRLLQGDPAEPDGPMKVRV